MNHRELSRVADTLNITDYTDYKGFLKALYRELQSRSICASYKTFSQLLGLGEGNVSWLIINGKRRITNNTIEKIIMALRLSNRKEYYFRRMVYYTNAGDTERRKLLRELEHARKPLLTEKQLIDGEFLNDWVVGVLREFIGLKQTLPDPAWVAKKFCLRITTAQVNKALGFLESIGYIKYSRRKNRYLLADRDYTADPKNFAAMSYYHQYFERAGESLEVLNAKERDYQVMILALSEENYRKAVTINKNALEEILRLEAAHDNEDAKIYQIGCPERHLS